MKPPTSLFRRFPSRRSRKRESDLALPPGSLVHFGAKRSPDFSIRCILFDEDSVEETTGDEPADLPSGEGRVKWHQVTGLHEIDRFSRLGEKFDIPNLILEDILNTNARAKIEKREDFVFVVTKLVSVAPDRTSIDAQQLSLLLLPDQTLLTFLEGPTSTLDPVVERIRTGIGGRIRRHGADYLLWALLDAVVDNYLFVIDRFDESITALEDQLELKTTGVEASEIYGLKRDVSRFFGSIRPIREITSSIRRQHSPLLDESSAPYFVDLNDHAIEVIESTEDMRERSSGLRDFFLSTVSNRMNEVMKVLTCFSTIFLPLTFFAGIYGMNFEHMPELGWKWAYPTLWAGFLLIAGGMFWLFRKMRWL